MGLGGWNHLFLPSQEVGAIAVRVVCMQHPWHTQTHVKSTVLPQLIEFP